MRDTMEKLILKIRDMKLKLFILLLIALVAHTILTAQAPTDDSSKYIWYKYQYGLRQPRIASDSFDHLPYGDTTGRRPFRPGAIMMHTDKKIYKWDSLNWKGIAVDALNLQQVTDNGPKTTDTIISAGVRTQDILADTLDQNDFEIDVLPDLQYYTYTPYVAILDSMFNWMRNNKTSENISAVLQVGDITDFAGATEFIRIDTQVAKLDNINVPLLFVSGNHDYNSLGSRNLTTYNTYFGPSRFAGKPYYGGNMDGSNANYFILFEAGGHKYMVIGLEFIPRDTALNWAQKIMDSLPARETIIVTHAYIARTGERSTDTTQWASVHYGITGNDGDDMWNKLIKKNKQIFLVVNGHFLNSGVFYNPPVVKRITEAGVKGNIVYQIVCNYQMDTLGGNGYFMRLKFKPRQAKINVSFYSPYLGQYDPRFPSYDLAYPVIKAGGVIGISDEGGGLNVAGEARFDSTVAITSLPKGRVVVTTGYGQGSKLDTLANQPANYVLASPSSTTGVVTPRLLTAADIPSGSGNYIQNQFSAAQTGNFWIQGKGVVGNFSDYSTLNGVPAQLYVTQGSGNWGLLINRVSAGISGAHLSFAHTTGASPSIKIPSSVGDKIGQINWFGISSDSLHRETAHIEGFAAKTGSNYVSGEIGFWTTDTAGASTEKMKLNSQGNLRLGGTSSTLYRLHIQSGDAYFAGNTYTIGNQGVGTASPTDRIHVAGTARITDTLKLPNILSKVDTSDFKPAIFDANGNVFKMTGWPLVAGSITSINSMTGPSITIQSGTATSVNNSSNTVTVNVTPASLALPHTLNKQYADVNNTGTSESDLYTYTLPANTLTIDGRSMHFETSGQLNDATATTNLRMYFAGTSFGNTGVVVLVNTGAWTAKGIIIRTGSTTARANVVFTLKAGTTDSSYTFQQDLTGLDFTVTNILKITGQAGGAGGGNNDITGKFWAVTYWPE